MRQKIIVIGLDGATLDVINPLVHMGHLPNLSRIMKTGVFGDLQSTIHPITPQAWTSFLTGKNAGKHGILDFTTRKEDTYDIQFVNASQRRAESILSLLSRAGRCVGAVAIPFTYPPESVNGCVLSGMDAPAGDSRAVYPATLYSEIKKKFGQYHIHLASPVGRKIDQDRFWEDIQKEDANRTAIGKYLMAKYPWDLFITVYNNTDRVQHQHLDEDLFQQLQNNGDVSEDNFLIETYKNADRQVGELLSDIDEYTTVIVMSDHGAGPIRKVFFLNRWLEQKGLLSFSDNRSNIAADTLHRARFIAKRFLPRRAKDLLKNRMAGVRDKLDSYLSFSTIEWQKTHAYGFGMYGNIFVNLKGREPEGIVEPGEEYNRVCDWIKDQLCSLTDPDTGENIVERVYRRDELYHGPYVENAPDLIIAWKDYAYYTSVSPGTEGQSAFGSFLKIDSSEYKHVGTHRLNGVFMAAGKFIRPNARLNGAGIYDICPTILYILGLQIPADMDGRVLTELFDEKYLQNNPPRYDNNQSKTIEETIVRYSSEESQQVAERLRGLGYLE